MVSGRSQQALVQGLPNPSGTRHAVAPLEDVAELGVVDIPIGVCRNRSYCVESNAGMAAVR